ncbi:MAG: hypothetical protein K2L78_08220, partial [Muribaculaceae bacterium]|nr:hypothetical protein [Muribaculaceae bacterium]
ISVTNPFQVSTDKSSWGTSVSLHPEEDRFYMRLFSQSAGTFSTTVTAQAEEYVNDNLDVDGTVVSARPSFHEDFEQKGESSYGDKTYTGTACSWATNAYFGTGSNTYPYSGNQAARLHNKKPGYLTMLEAKQGGMGTLSLWARLWGSENKTATLTVSVSSDMGATWEKAGTIIIEPVNNGAGNSYREYTLQINRQGSLRLKIEQDIVSRTLIDDIRISDFKTSAIGEANSAEYHSWDAYCRNGRLVMESLGNSADFANVYSVDGTECFAGTLAQGETVLDLTPGLYIVVVRDFARRVLVR